MKSGFVTFVGRPNAGKSTLLNKILGEKVSITSNKPQTTRNRVMGVLHRDDAQIVFVDTPGIHKPVTALGERLNDTAGESMSDVDVVCLVLDASAPFGKGDQFIADQLPDGFVVVVTKGDRASREQMVAQIQATSSLPASEWFPVSGRTGKGVEALIDHAGREGFAWILDGTNADDLGDHRPGLRAADEAEVVSPLIEAGLGKDEVRVLAKELGLPNWDKPAAACLASRIPYGTPVTLERLAQVEAAEAALQALGFVGLRVRHHDQVARIELPADQMQQILAPDVRLEVATAVKAAGFLYVSLDLEGFRSGSGNVALTVSGANA